MPDAAATQTVAETVQSNLDKVTDRLLQFADKIGESAGPAGKAAWEVAMIAIRLQAIVNLAGSALSMIAAALVFKFAVLPLWRKMANSGDDSMFGYFLAASVLTIFSAGVAVVAFISLLTAATWVSAISPEAGLALKVIDGVTK